MGSLVAGLMLNAIVSTNNGAIACGESSFLWNKIFKDNFRSGINTEISVEEYDGYYVIDAIDFQEGHYISIGTAPRYPHMFCVIKVIKFDKQTQS